MEWLVSRFRQASDSLGANELALLAQAAEMADQVLNQYAERSGSASLDVNVQEGKGPGRIKYWGIYASLIRGGELLQQWEVLLRRGHSETSWQIVTTPEEARRRVEAAIQSWLED